MKIINDLLSIYKFIIISIISIKIIVIIISFDFILKSFSISTKIQYIIDFSLVFVVYHYWTWEFVLLIRQEIIDNRAKRSEWNISWTCIDSDNFSLYEELMKSKLMKESSILSFSFLKDLAVMMFLSFRNIFDSIL